MTQPAFFFNPNLCTGCAACAIACQVENQRLPDIKGHAPRPWRTIYTRNPVNDPSLPSFHLSLACNHCLEPACQLACPASAITKDSLTGAVLIDPRRCIGCGYCAWACPFDAPHYNQSLGVMEKCTFCQPRLLNASQPACTTACPTGALSLGLLSQANPGTMAALSGFPKTTLKPAIRFEPLRSSTILQDAIPAAALLPAAPSPEISLKTEWPLWALTTTLPVLFAWFAGFPTVQHIPYPNLDAAFLAVGLLALLVSTLHLGRPLRSWRALSNVNTSWLSREILFTVAFVALSGGVFGLSRLGTNDFLYQTGGLVVTSLLLFGLLALVSIDQVYAVLRSREAPPTPDELYRPRLPLHSASALLGGLTLAGIIALAAQSPPGPLTRLLAVIGVLSGVLQLCLYANRHTNQEPATPFIALVRFTRVTLGFILPAILLAADSPLWLILACAWAGFAIDRVEFYNLLQRVKPGW